MCDVEHLTKLFAGWQGVCTVYLESLLYLSAVIIFKGDLIDGFHQAFLPHLLGAFFGRFSFFKVNGSIFPTGK